MKVTIILINWHGADDTISCLVSLSKMNEPHKVVIADNGSTDDSVARIRAWLNEHSGERHVDGYRLVELGKNYGFAVGNNKAIAFAMQDNPDYCMLLNNDTEVEPDMLTKLLDCAQAHKNVKVLSPCICYHYDKNKVWFSGGKLTFGTRKNLFAEQRRGVVGLEPFVMDFVSGCALFFETSLLDGNKELLYNGFFFGEEDYEFSLRMRKMGIKMACVPQSLVYHKVGSSQKNTKDSRGLGRIYMYYHNRLICNRLYESRLKFYIICLLNCMTCLKYFKNYSGSLKTAIRLVRRLFRDVRTKNDFNNDDFRALMFEDRYFDFDVTFK